MPTFDPDRLPPTGTSERGLRFMSATLDDIFHLRWTKASRRRHRIAYRHRQRGERP